MPTDTATAPDTRASAQLFSFHAQDGFLRPLTSTAVLVDFLREGFAGDQPSNYCEWHKVLGAVEVPNNKALPLTRYNIEWLCTYLGDYYRTVDLIGGQLRHHGLNFEASLFEFVKGLQTDHGYLSRELGEARATIAKLQGELSDREAAEAAPTCCATLELKLREEIAQRDAALRSAEAQLQALAMQNQFLGIRNGCLRANLGLLGLFSQLVWLATAGQKCVPETSSAPEARYRIGVDTGEGFFIESDTCGPLNLAQTEIVLAQALREHPADSVQLLAVVPFDVEISVSF